MKGWRPRGKRSPWFYKSDAEKRIALARIIMRCHGNLARAAREANVDRLWMRKLVYALDLYPTVLYAREMRRQLRLEGVMQRRSYQILPPLLQRTREILRERESE